MMAESTKIPLYIINHVFLPPKLPQKDDLEEHDEQALCQNVYRAAREFRDALPSHERQPWNSITNFLEQFSLSRHRLALSERPITDSMQSMQSGDVLAFLIRAQNAGVIIRKEVNAVVFELFEVAPPNEVVMSAKGRLLCSFPGPAIQISTQVFEDPKFQAELTRFLVAMDVDPLDSAPTTKKANSEVKEVRDTEDPRYITQLLTEILRGMGDAVEVPRITKRIGDDVLWSDAYKPWRRSATWLVLRVALQTTLLRQSQGNQLYKAFMVFLHVRILKLGLRSDLPSYLIDCMRKKTARRLHKLGSTAPSFLTQLVAEVMNQTQDLLQQRWTEAQSGQASSLSSTWAPKTLNIFADTTLTLHNSKEYLKQSLRGSGSGDSIQLFNPNHSSRILGTDNFTRSRIDQLETAFKSNDHLIALADFERAVLSDLSGWATRNLHSEDGCGIISTLVTLYSEAASEVYSSDPELLSVMLLTLFKLWVELDRMALTQCPLLANFSPEVPCKLLHSLLLRTSESIEALDYVENYLKTRHSNAVSGQSVFASSSSHTSFTVQYFDSHGHLQTLKARIDGAASTQRAQKRDELRRLKAQYNELLRSAGNLEHGYVSRWKRYEGAYRMVHDWGCQKCSLEEQARVMTINIHEWPLPQDPLEAKAVVFELAPPIPFVIWRRITYMLLRDICIPEPYTLPEEPSQMHLRDYPALLSYHAQHDQFTHISFASRTKSFEASHYRHLNVSGATEENICVNHGLQWKLFYNPKSEWVTQDVANCTINDYCTLKLPHGRYHNLQYAVSRTSHTSNEILANQIDCSQELTLHEFMAFARIRSGPRLQWLNIISELRSSCLSFQEEAVYALLRQTVWQIGPLSTDGKREWHTEPSEKEFGEVLLSELHDLLVRLEANWRNVVGMRVISVLISRLLASATDNVVLKGGFRLMREVRRVTYDWLKELASKLRDIDDEGRMREYQMQVCEMAATCRGTYDVDIDKAREFLFSIDDVAIFIHCAILVHHNSPPKVGETDARLRNLLYRDRRLSHVMEGLLSQQITQLRDGLDQAILEIWRFYRPSSNWEHLPSPNNRWVTTHTAPEGTQRSQAVQLDLLTGQLLIDGKSLGRLPHSIITHPTYSRIFGQRILDVIPADMPGMDYKTRNRIGSNQTDPASGYEVFFVLRSPESGSGQSRLVIRTQQGTQILELIPHDVFEDDLPDILVQDKTHWLNISTAKGEIEVRDLKTRWNTSSHNWRIQFTSEGCSTMLRRLSSSSGSLRLIDPRSITMSMVSAQFRPLENAGYLIVTYSDDSGQLAVSLPRLRLEFFLNKEAEPQLESLNMPGMVIDSDQSSGTMIGLKSQLILRAKVLSEPWLRQVIVPYSPNSRFVISSSGHHSNATISIGGQRIIRYLKYTINTTLGRLEGDGSMLSKLYQIYLHAITSYCLPDPLTGQTGTEEALQELRSAGLLSFQKLGVDTHQLLREISKLTPTRIFYPAHLKAMQTVGWSKHTITPLAQHADFRTLTNSIWQYAKTLGMFSPTKDAITPIDTRQTSDHLLDRAANRNAVLYRDQIDGLRPPPEQPDSVYDSRGNSNTADERTVFNTSAMVFNWDSRLSTDTQLYHTLTQRESISGITEEISLAYSRDWLGRDISKYFLSACNACRTSSREENRYQIAFSLCAWAYTSVDIRPLIPTILAFATVSRLQALSPPSYSLYDLSAGLEATEAKISEIISQCTPNFDESAGSNTNQYEVEQRISVFNQRRSLEVRELIDILKRQWPCSAPGIPNSREWLFDVQQLERAASTTFGTWFRNKGLSEYIRNVQQILDEVRWLTPTRPTTPYAFSPNHARPRSNINNPQLHKILTEREVPEVPRPPTPLHHGKAQNYVLSQPKSHNLDQLRGLLLEFGSSTFLSHQDGKLASIQVQYADDLEESLRSLVDEIQPENRRGTSETQTSEDIHDYYNRCKEHLQDTYRFIQESLLPSTEAERVLYTAGLWPCLARRSLLGVLSFGSNVDLTAPWRKALNSFARSVLRFQRACRLKKCFHEHNMDEFSSEFKNTLTEAEDNDEQSSMQLLIQVDGNFLARPIQLDFMKEMIDPSSGSNTALQLNMGEGKSSVIVPMAAAALSDGQKLVRVIVLKQLASSMFQLLVHRLGGLANRRIFYLPFSRSPQLTLNQAQQVQELFLECVRMRGVLVVQPEHILSFKLMGLDRRFNLVRSSDSSNSDVANRLLESQRWLSNNSRDILDESDEILHVRYQLTYTVGQQRLLQGSPDRWTIVQQTLTLVRKHAQTVKKSHSDGIEVQVDNFGGYPRIRVLQDDAAKELLRLVAKDISGGALEQCSFGLFPPHLRSLALSYITKLNLTSEDTHLLENHCKESECWNTLLILRGLLAHGILHFVLREKRWRVDYGLDPSRSMLAVPYRAKDVPSLRAEFSHPDVAILLTCLSYYWQGITKAQLQQCVELLFKQDNPVLEYEKWVHQAPGIREQLKHLSAINMYDLDQRAELHGIFHHNQAIIDFFLSQVVFPRDAKEFPNKMATSGWDLAERKHHVTTGFSGTKDGGYLLPTSIDQADPLLQSSTNAKVLAYLLQPENNHYRCIHQSGQQNSEQDFLHMLDEQEPKIRVLLDVGAQILKLSNEEVAANWLDFNSDQNVLAIVFFGPEDEPYVRTRNGVTEALVSSPFRQQLDRCLLYLDDVHTRGTDFKLPAGTRAAVTLGPKVTKDRLLQGCMRMRKLGYGHSVMFFAPPEVDHSIRTAAGLDDEQQIQVKDILLWTMLESCLEVVHRISQWTQQGIDHRHREQAWKKFNESPDTSIDHLESVWVRQEARSLEDMYALQVGPKAEHSHRLGDHPDISERYLKWARSSFSDSRIEEEEEREVIAEVEVERQIERPPKVIAATPQVHDDVRTLVRTGVFRANSSAYVPLFQPLDGTLFEERSWASQYLFSTRDFSVTVQSSRYGGSSDYLRPVNWVLSAAQPTGEIFVVLSSHEVNELLPDIRRSDKVHLHQYAPRVTQAMKSFEHLTFHCIPSFSVPWHGPSLDIITRLNIWGGQLYLEDKKAYRHLCNFLGLYSWQPKEDDVIQLDGFIKPEHRRDSLLLTCSFVGSPVTYLKSLLGSRRKGMDYFPTHMGKILRSRLLTEEDF